jgi:hypothetical protein
VYAEQGSNTVFAEPLDGDQDTIFCGWEKDQNYGRVLYSAATGTPLHVTPPTRTRGVLYFGDNIKCCTIWTKDPDTGVETKLAERRQVKCMSAPQPAARD